MLYPTELLGQEFLGPLPFEAACGTGEGRANENSRSY